MSMIQLCSRVEQSQMKEEDRIENLAVRTILPSFEFCFVPASYRMRKHAGTSNRKRHHRDIQLRTAAFAMVGNVDWANPGWLRVVHTQARGLVLSSSACS